LPIGGIERVHRPIEAVLFDLDETLIDALRGLRAAHADIARRILSLCGKEIAFQSILMEVARLDDEMNERREYDRDIWWPKLMGRLGCEAPLSADVVRTLTTSYWRSYARAATPYDDAEEVLRYLKGKGYRLGVVTDTDGAIGIKRERIEALSLKGLFDTIVIAGEDTRATKPDPEPYLLAARRLGVPAAHCVFVGDKPFTDIKGANAAGMRSILVMRRQWSSEEAAGFTIKRLAEIEGIL
jgi:putative hydrolase of the HAD superfamily